MSKAFDLLTKLLAKQNSATLYKTNRYFSSFFFLFLSFYFIWNKKRNLVKIMKLYSILILRKDADKAKILASQFDLSSFGYFQRGR